jgi:hypothetical protein
MNSSAAKAARCASVGVSSQRTLLRLAAYARATWHGTSLIVAACASSDPVQREPSRRRQSSTLQPFFQPER